MNIDKLWLQGRSNPWLDVSKLLDAKYSHVLSAVDAVSTPRSEWSFWMRQAIAALTPIKVQEIARCEEHLRRFWAERARREKENASQASDAAGSSADADRGARWSSLGSHLISFKYTNHRGVVARRHVDPRWIEYTSNEYHKESCWLLVGTDRDRGGEVRTYPLSHMWDIVDTGKYARLRWHVPERAIRDGRMYLLVVKQMLDDRSSCPLEDEEFYRTVGWNNFENDGIDEWKFAGWNWENDHFAEGRGKVVAVADMAAVLATAPSFP